MKKIALLGPAYAEYPTSVRTTINHVKQRDEEGKCLSNWTFQHDPDMLKLLYDQIENENIGYVNLYVYSTKKIREPGTLHGTGNILNQ